MPSHGFKVLVIGDDYVGKTSLVQRCVYGDFTPQYVPTARDDYIIRRRISDGSTNISQRICLGICDTGGQGMLDRLRPLCYSEVDVIIVCYSVVNPVSFKNITDKWMPEIQRHAQNNAYFLLVGTQTDKRSDLNVLIKLSDNGLAPVSEAKGLKMAQKIGAAGYIESSALTAKNVTEIFDLSLLLCLQRLEKQLETHPDLPDVISGHSPRLKHGKRQMVSRRSWKDMDSYSTISKKSGGSTISGNKSFSGQGGGSVTVPSKLFSRQWRHKKSFKLKQLLLLSCLPY